MAEIANVQQLLEYAFKQACFEGHSQRVEWAQVYALLLIEDRLTSLEGSLDMTRQVLEDDVVKAIRFTAPD